MIGSLTTFQAWENKLVKTEFSTLYLNIIGDKADEWLCCYDIALADFTEELDIAETERFDGAALNTAKMKGARIVAFTHD